LRGCVIVVGFNNINNAIIMEIFSIVCPYLDELRSYHRDRPRTFEIVTHLNESRKMFVRIINPTGRINDPMFRIHIWVGGLRCFNFYCYAWYGLYETGNNVYLIFEGLEDGSYDRRTFGADCLNPSFSVASVASDVLDYIRFRTAVLLV